MGSDEARMRGTVDNKFKLFLKCFIIILLLANKKKPNKTNKISMKSKTNKRVFSLFKFE